MWCLDEGNQCSVCDGIWTFWYCISFRDYILTDRDQSNSFIHNLKLITPLRISENLLSRKTYIRTYVHNFAYNFRGFLDPRLSLFELGNISEKEEKGKSSSCSMLPALNGTTCNSMKGYVPCHLRLLCTCCSVSSYFFTGPTTKCSLFLWEAICDSIGWGWVNLLCALRVPLTDSNSRSLLSGSSLAFHHQIVSWKGEPGYCSCFLSGI